MAELQDPAYLGNGCITAQGDRQVLASMVCSEGVTANAGGELEVTADTPASMDISVASGNAFIEGTDITWQGMYHVSNDAAKTLTVTTADPTDDRIDIVVATVRDTETGGLADDWLLQIIAGTPSPAPIAPTLPDNSLLLATIAVGAGVTTITTGDITDGRVFYTLCADTSAAWLIQALSAVVVADVTTVTVPVSGDDGTHSSHWSLAANQWTYNGIRPIVADLSVTVMWDDSSGPIGGVIETWIEVNGTLILHVADDVGAATQGPGFSHGVAGGVIINPGDVIRVRVTQDSSGSRNVLSGRLSATQVASP